MKKPIEPITTTIVKLKAKGLTHRQIAERVGWKKTSIKTYLKKLRQTPATEKQKAFLAKQRCPTDISKFQAILAISKFLGKFGKHETYS